MSAGWRPQCTTSVSPSVGSQRPYECNHRASSHRYVQALRMEVTNNVAGWPFATSSLSSHSISASKRLRVAQLVRSRLTYRERLARRPLRYQGVTIHAYRIVAHTRKCKEPPLAPKAMSATRHGWTISSFAIEQCSLFGGNNVFSENASYSEHTSARDMADFEHDHAKVVLHYTCN